MSQMQPVDPYRAPDRGVPSGGWDLARSSWQSAQPAVRTDQRQVDGAVLAIAWVLAVLTLGYLLPWAVAATRGRSNQAAIGLLNLFLGWSVLGWIAALVMACQSHQVTGGGATMILAQQFPPAQFGAPWSPAPQLPAPQRQSPPAGWYRSPAGSGQQYWDGSAWTEHRAP